MKFDTLSQPGKVDYILLRRRLEREQAQVRAEGRQDAEIAKLVPFQQTIIGFEEARRRMETIDGQKTAGQLARLSVEIAAARDSKPAAPPAGAGGRGGCGWRQLRNLDAVVARLLRAVRPEVLVVGGGGVQEVRTSLWRRSPRNCIRRRARRAR